MNAIRITASAMLAALMLSTSAQAQATVQNYQVRGKGMSATFYSYDDCGYVSGYVYSSESASRMTGSGGPVTTAYSYAYLWGYDYCTGSTFEGSGWSEGGPTVTGGLSSATASVPMTLQTWACGDNNGYWECWYDVIGTGTLNVTINATTPATRGMSMNQWHSGGYRSSSRQNGTYRSGDATGSLVVNGTDYLAATTGWGDISDNANGSVTIYRQ